MDRQVPLIRLRDVVVRRGESLLLRGLDLDVCAGEHVAVLGSNGAGKSTLLALLRGDLPPTSGLREYDFGSGAQSSPIGLRQRMGLVSPALQDRFVGADWSLSARQAVCAGFHDSWLCHVRPTEKEWEQAGQWLEQIGAAELADRPVCRLSTGQLRLVLLARALVTEPVLLFLDEYLDGLDMQARARLLEAMSRAGRSCTLVCAVHDEADLPACVHRGVLLREGRVAARESVSGLSARRRKPVAGLQPDPPTPEPVRASWLFRLTNVSVLFEGRAALDGVNWTVRPGEHWAVLGGNGAGKSTLLRVLLGLEDVYPGGRMGWFGVDRLPDLTEVRRRVGYVSGHLQGTYSYDLSVREIVWSGFFGSVGLYDLPDEAQRDRAERMLAFFGLTKLADRRIRSLSYGQLRRALLARATVGGAPVLLLDEPLTGLDKQARPMVLASLERLADAGTHLVYVTHHVGELISALSHVLCLDQGHVTYCGTRAGAGL